MSDIEGYLSSKGIQYKKNATQLYMLCFFHGETEKPGKLYINNTGTDRHGLYHCKKCGARGNFTQLQRHFGDEPTITVHSETAFRILRTAAKLYHAELRDEDIHWLVNSRGLTEDTIRSRGLGRTPGRSWLVPQLQDQFSEEELLGSGLIKRTQSGALRDHFFASGITIPYFAGSNCVSLRWRNLESDKPKYLSTEAGENRLYNVNTTWGADDEIVICEGEFDAMVMEQLGYRTVGLPGASTWEPQWASYVDEARRVWVVCDPDEEGLRGADKVQSSIGAKAKIVHLPVPEGIEAKKVDPTYLVVHGAWRKNHFDHLFTKAAQDASLLRSPAQARKQFETDQEVGGLLTGWEMLDNTLGGIRRPNLVIPVARTNVGKTMFLLNLLQRMSMVPGQTALKFLLLTLEQTGGEWFDRARRIWNFYNLDCEPEKVHDETEAYWMPRLRYVEKNQLNELEIRACIDDFSVEFGEPPDLICVDYLGYLARGYEGDTTQRVSAAAQSLKGIAKEINRPIVVPSQASRKTEHGRELSLDDARDSGEVENVGDVVAGLWSPDTAKGRKATDRTGEIINKILKSRATGKGKEVKFHFAPLSLVWVESTETDNVKKAKQEITWDNFGDISWQEAMLAHRLGQPPKNRVALS